MRIVDKICEKTKKTYNFAPFVVFLFKFAKGVVPRKKARYTAGEILKKGEIFHEISEKISGETCGSS